MCAFPHSSGRLFCAVFWNYETGILGAFFRKRSAPIATQTAWTPLSKAIHKEASA